MTNFRIFMELVGFAKIYNYKNGDRAIFVDDEKIILNDDYKNLERLAIYVRENSSIIIPRKGKLYVSYLGALSELQDEEHNVLMSIFEFYFNENVDKAEYNFLHDMSVEMRPTINKIKNRIAVLEEDRLAMLRVKEEQFRKEKEEKRIAKLIN